jgi:hypothetical protein
MAAKQTGNTTLKRIAAQYFIKAASDGEAERKFESEGWLANEFIPLQASSAGRDPVEVTLTRGISDLLPALYPAKELPSPI